jgi:hypothetical protein
MIVMVVPNFMLSPLKKNRRVRRRVNAAVPSNLSAPAGPDAASHQAPSAKQQSRHIVKKDNLFIRNFFAFLQQDSGSNILAKEFRKCNIPINPRCSHDPFSLIGDSPPDMMFDSGTGETSPI